MTDSPRRRHQLQTLSRFLSMLLRHQPTRFPVRLDPQGYANLDQVMRILKALPNFRWATRGDINAVLDLPGKARFELTDAESGTRIRALYGHSALRLEYEPIEPPDALYYAIAPESWDIVLQEGLVPQDRAYIQLAETPEEARRYALRISADPVILRVDAAAAHAAGVKFYTPAEGVYLVDLLPATYLQVL